MNFITTGLEAIMTSANIDAKTLVILVVVALTTSGSNLYTNGNVVDRIELLEIQIANSELSRARESALFWEDQGIESDTQKRLYNSTLHKIEHYENYLRERGIEP